MDLLQAANSPQFNKPYLHPENFTIFALDKTKSTPTLITLERAQDVNPRLHKRITAEEWAAICEKLGNKQRTVDELLGNDLPSTEFRPVKSTETEARFLQLKAQWPNVAGKERLEYFRLKEIYDPKLTDTPTE